MTNVELLEALKKTRLALTVHGWGQGAYRNDRGQICLSQAIIYAVIDSIHHVPSDEYHLVANAILLQRNKIPGKLFTSAVNFNDDADTTEADVFAAVDQAIEYASRW